MTDRSGTAQEPIDMCVICAGPPGSCHNDEMCPHIRKRQRTKAMTDPMTDTPEKREAYLEANRHPSRYIPCGNSLGGFHRWRRPEGKNASKPLGCQNCSFLEADLLKKDQTHD